MPISSVHPTYNAQTEDWETMRDSLKGDKAIRASIRKYLPPPPGMDLRGTADINDILGMSTKGIQSRYSFYTSFAEWPEIVQMTLNAVQGLVHEKPPTIELPDDLQYLTETATPSGDSMLDLWEMVTRETFASGRVAMLSEIFDDQVLICLYRAEALINWHVLPRKSGGNAVLAVLMETKSIPKAEDKYEHEDITHYRELQLFADRLDDGTLGPAEYQARVWEAKDGKDPTIIVTDETDEHGWITPQFFGQSWEEIPLTVNNANDKGFKFGPLPLISAARRAISIFRKTADYFRSLYNKGDPQAVLFGVDKEDAPSNIGGSSIWTFPESDGSAMYLDIDGQGIPMQKTAIDDQYDRFEQETGRLVAPDAGAINAASGEALRRRAANQQVTVKSLVINAAASMQAHLRLMARLMGKSDDQVAAIMFTPNLDFAEPMMTGREFMDYVLAKNAGGPLATETLHDLARTHKITDRDFDEEMALIEAEGPTAADIQLELDEEKRQRAIDNAGNEDDEDGDGDGDEDGDAEGDGNAEAA